MPESSIQVNSQRMLGAINKIVRVKKSCKEAEFFLENSASPILVIVVFLWRTN